MEGLYAANPIGTRSVTVHVHTEDCYSDDEDTTPPVLVTYGPNECPEVIVNAIYQRFNPRASNEAAYNASINHHIIAVWTSEATLWSDEMKCPHCRETRIPYLDGRCPRCQHAAASLFSYNLQPDADVRALVGSMAYQVD